MTTRMQCDWCNAAMDFRSPGNPFYYGYGFDIAVVPAS